MTAPPSAERRRAVLLAPLLAALVLAIAWQAVAAPAHRRQGRRTAPTTLGKEAPAKPGTPAHADSAGAGRGRVLDSFDTVDGWKAVPADGVTMKLSSDAGAIGKSLRIDFAFVKGGGYAVVHRDVGFDLPANYRFDYRLRADAPVNNLEFKLVDATGANVWWLNRRDVSFPHDWQTQTVKKRHLSFAWGPAGGGEIHHVAAIEFAITAGTGGKGTVWLDDLELTPLPPVPERMPEPEAHASSSRPLHPAEFAADEDPKTEWASRPEDPTPSLELDLGIEREFGGLTIAWAPGQRARDYLVETSSDHAHWSVQRAVRGGTRLKDYLAMPESEARWVRLRMLKAEGAPDVGVSELTLEPLEWGATPAQMFATMAADAPRGAYPRGIRGEQPYWTVVGTDQGDHDPGLLGEDGALELGLGGPSIEPFLRIGGRLVTWADARIEQRLAGPGDAGGGDWPIPEVVWHAAGLDLTVQAFAVADSAPRAGAPPTAGLVSGNPRLVARYRLHNGGAQPVSASLWLALRPFQVDPPTQQLNHPGGIATLREIAATSGYGGALRIRADDRAIVPVESPSAFGACTFDQGDVWDYLGEGRIPNDVAVRDVQSLASAVLVYRLDLPAGGTRTLSVVTSAHEPGPDPNRLSEADVDAAFATMRRRWESHRRGIVIRGPADSSAARGGAPIPPELAAIWPNVGYVLAERDGPAIRPGTRSYARSWIRDGALASAALLRLGQTDAVRAFAEWYATHQYDNGKIPCCVDARGADPVPEHDSAGEFIYLVAEYERYTHDRPFAVKLWPHVHAAAMYLDSLRHQRLGKAWDQGEAKTFHGLLPPSISHEGYSAQPMHSYWDDLFALRGFRDASWLAKVVGKHGEQERWFHVGSDFARDLGASIRASMAAHHIGYVPGCADLGDFDATSTTIALAPVEARAVLPPGALEQTFQRYYAEFKQRKSGVRAWDAYTPYELRSVGAFVRLGWRDRAAELLDWLDEGQRPAGWHQWPEVVWHDARAPHFLGDLPHAWVGSDYLRSALDMLAYADGDSLVLAAGVPRRWIAGEGLHIAGLRTPFGPLAYAMHARGDGVEVRIEGGLQLPRNGLWIDPPPPAFRGPYRRATIDGRTATVQDGRVRVNKLPAVVVMQP